MFANARIFEEQLLQVTRAALEGKGQVVQHQLLRDGRDGAPVFADLVFIPNEGAFADKPIIVEFKFSRTTTLPHSIVLSALQHFGAIRAANLDQNPRFVLVTNGRVRALPNIPTDVSIVDSVRNRNIWKRMLVEVVMGRAS